MFIRPRPLKPCSFRARIIRGRLSINFGQAPVFRPEKLICYLGIGSNLGNRSRNIQQAIRKVRQLKKTNVLKVSKLIETVPIGGPKEQPKFLNGALKIKTRLSPHALLKELKKIERRLGRVKTARHGPRVIDLDILLYMDRIIQSEKLTIPHPRMFQRDFVLKPLAEII